MEALDVVFGVDMSSKTLPRIPSIKLFMEELSKSLIEKTTHLNLGSLKFGSEAEVTFPYQLQSSSDLFVGMVKRLSVADGGRALDAALLKAYESFFKPRHNSDGSSYLTVERIRKIILSGGDVVERLRKDQKTDRKKLFVLLVGGKHLKSDATNIIPSHASRLLNDLGVKIIVVTFGNKEVDRQLKDIAENPGDVFNGNKASSASQVMRSLCERFGKSEYHFFKFHA